MAASAPQHDVRHYNHAHPLPGKGMLLAHRAGHVDLLVFLDFVKFAACLLLSPL
jgi:hypothetical protein